MRRREFIKAIVGSAAAWPIAAFAPQPGPVRRIGVLIGFGKSDPEGETRLTAFRQELVSLGWTDGGNLRIDDRRFAGDADRVRVYNEARYRSSSPKSAIRGVQGRPGFNPNPLRVIYDVVIRS